MPYNQQTAEHWDAFINWPRREAIEGKWLRRLLRKHRLNSILDVAAGTGFHAITLAKYGFIVEAWDKSSPMLRIASRNARAAGVKIKLKKQAWLSKSDVDGRLFNSIICLGNSFSHLLSSFQRKNALKRWHSLLTNNGIMVLDVRNFSTLISSKHTQQPFCYHGRGLVNYVLLSNNRIDLKYKFRDGYACSLSYALLTPLEISNEALASGFRLIDVYGNGNKHFDPEEVDFYQMAFRKQI